MRANHKWRFINRILGACAAIVLLTSIACGGWALWLHTTGNIHTVEPGLVYRSKQLTASDIKTLIKKDNIKTIINLRGDNSGSDWYDSEVAAVHESGVEFINVKMSASREPSPDTLALLLKTLASAPTPILIHCKDGADRSGLASALYLLTVMHRPANIADRQLSFRYGHFPWLTSRTGAMDRAFWQVVASGHQ